MELKEMGLALKLGKWFAFIYVTIFLLALVDLFLPSWHPGITGCYKGDMGIECLSIWGGHSIAFLLNIPLVSLFIYSLLFGAKANTFTFFMGALFAVFILITLACSIYFVFNLIKQNNGKNK